MTMGKIKIVNMLKKLRRCKTSRHDRWKIKIVNLLKKLQRCKKVVIRLVKFENFIMPFSHFTHHYFHTFAFCIFVHTWHIYCLLCVLPAGILNVFICIGYRVTVNSKVWMVLTLLYIQVPLNERLIQHCFSMSPFRY